MLSGNWSGTFFSLSLCYFSLAQFWLSFQQFLLSVGSCHRKVEGSPAGSAVGVNRCPCSRLFSPVCGKELHSQIPHSFHHCCSCVGSCLARNPCWQFYCSVLKLLWRCSVAFFLFSLQKRCRYHVIVRLLVVCLYPIYFRAHGITIHLVLNAAPGLLGLLSKCSVLLCMMRLKNCTAATAIFPESLSCADFQHVILME